MEMTANKQVIMDALAKLEGNHKLGCWDKRIDTEINTKTLKRKLYLDDSATLEITKKKLIEVDFISFGSYTEVDFGFIAPDEYADKYGETYN